MYNIFAWPLRIYFTFNFFCVRNLRCVCAGYACDTAEKRTSSPEVCFRRFVYFSIHFVGRAHEMGNVRLVYFNCMWPNVYRAQAVFTVEHCLPIERILDRMHNGLDGKARETEAEMSKFIEYRHHT